MNHPYPSSCSSSQSTSFICLNANLRSWAGVFCVFYDKAVQQHHALPRHAENHPPDLSISQIAPHFPQAVCRDCDNRACQAASRTRPSECPAPPVCDLPRSAPGPTPARGGFRGRIRRRTPGASWSDQSILIVPNPAPAQLARSLSNVP